MTVDKKCCLLLQDFEIAGSQTGGAGALDSPLGTVHSWDSHANYRLRLDASPPVPLFSGVIVYCDHTHLLTSIGFIRLLLVVGIFSNIWYYTWIKSVLSFNHSTLVHVLAHIVSQGTAEWTNIVTSGKKKLSAICAVLRNFRGQLTTFVK